MEQQNQPEGLYTAGELINQAPVPPQSPQYDRIIQEEKVSNFISQTSPSRSLIKIDWILKGYAFDETKREWVKVTHGIPDQIRMDFLQALTPHLTEDVRMTRLDRKQINGIMEFLIEWAVDYLDIVADSYYFHNADKIYKKRIINDYDLRQRFVFDYHNGWMFLEHPVEITKLLTEQESLTEEQMTKIFLMICSAVFYSISRAENGVERDRMYASLKMGDDFGAYAKQEEKKSILSQFLPWK